MEDLLRTRPSVPKKNKKQKVWKRGLKRSQPQSRLEDDYPKKSKIASSRILEPLSPTLKAKLNKLSEERTSTPFQKNSIVLGPQNPKVLQSFLANFLNDDLGSFKLHIDLCQHVIDSGIPVTDATLQELADLHPHIQGIHAENCTEITDIGLWALARNCVLLTSVNFSRCNKITHVGLRSLALRCNNLQAINLNWCEHVTDLGLRVLAAGSPNMRELYLQGCTQVSDTGVSEIANCCKGIQILKLTGCKKLCEYGDRALVDLGRNCPELRQLDLSKCIDVSDSGVRAIARGCPLLEELNLSGCVTISGVAIRAIGRGCVKLKSLVLRDCKLLDNQDIWIIAEYLRQLVNLDLQNIIKIKPHGIRGICEWLTGLEVLNLAGCPNIDNICCTLLGNSMNKLSALNLKGNDSVDEAGIRNLCQGCTRLVHLELDSCRKISHSFLQSLAQSLPFVLCASDRVALVPRRDADNLIRQTEQMRIDTAAAVVIQKLIRGVRVRGGVLKIRRFAMRRFVVPKFQALARGFLCRKSIRLKREAKETIRAALLLQRFYRGHRGRTRATMMRRIRGMQSDHAYACLRIQCVFRGWKDRQRIAEIRRQKALKALRKSELRNQEEVMALRIQRNFRGRQGYLQYVARLKVKHGREQRANEELQAAIMVQKHWHRKAAYIASACMRAAEVQLALELSSILILQRTYRGCIGRKLAKAAKRTRRWQLEQQSALVIQCAWRGCKGRHITAIMKSFGRLLQREIQAAIKIQSLWRCKQGQGLIEYLRQAAERERLKKAAAINIQRLFRGHKGQEELEVKRELSKSQELIAPLLTRQDELEVQRDELQNTIAKEMIFVNKLKVKVAGMQKELTEVSKHRSKWYDSANITGTLQRYQTNFLAHALRTGIEANEAAILQIEENVLDALNAQLRQHEKDLRAVLKEMGPKEVNLAFFVRQNRAKKRYDLLKRKRQSCKLIQKVFRAYRVRVAVELGGEHWEKRAGENGAIMYFNVYSQEHTYDMPWPFKVLQEEHHKANLSFARVVEKSQQIYVWKEYFDDSSGYPFYYNSKTGEYRWDKPNELLQQEQESSKNHEWLQNQNQEQLTSRSARMRGIRAGWVEYRDDSNQVYFYNSVTQMSQWEKPPEFEQEWLRSQDTAALTSRSSKLRVADAWTEYEDDDGHRYFYNNETGETQWEKPEGFDTEWLSNSQVTSRSIKTRDMGANWEELLDPVSGYTYYFNSETSESRWSLSPREIIAPGTTSSEESGGSEEWVQYFDEEQGLPYYYKPSTDAVRWTLDADSDVTWLENQDELTLSARSIPIGSLDDHWEEMMDTETGNMYYWNKTTGETCWTIQDLHAGDVLPPKWTREDFKPDDELTEEQLAEMEKRDPKTYRTSYRILQVFHDSLEYDLSLKGKIEYLCSVENDTILEDIEYVESIQWLAECLLAGQLLSAVGVVDHALAHIESKY